MVIPITYIMKAFELKHALLFNMKNIMVRKHAKLNLKKTCIHSRNLVGKRSIYIQNFLGVFFKYF